MSGAMILLLLTLDQMVISMKKEEEAILTLLPSRSIAYR